MTILAAVIVVATLIVITLAPYSSSPTGLR
jgi:hypothetical protein